MQVLNYDRFQETLYFDRLSNGLEVYILPKKGFQKTYATFSTRFGSIHNDFQVEGRERIQVPDGIAHFLEHKMFEEPKGDVFAQFASQGASSNAFTSFDRTAYLFSATEQIESNVETLLNFVQNPYFTDENVEKEKGIIGQEINMYKDHPDWQSYYGLIQAMYHAHPIHIDIAGTIESITQITKEMLYQCYNTFYHPSNMSLFIVGGVDPEQMMLLVTDNQAKKTFHPQGKIHRYFPEEPQEVKEARRIIRLAVSLPKCMIGLKETKLGFTGQELLKRECETKLMLDYLFSPSSSLYQQLYEDNIISDSFGSEYQCHPDYAFAVMGGDTPDPDQLISRIQAEVERVKSEGIPQEDFERIRKKRIGGFMRMLNSPEALANEFMKYRFRDQDLFDMASIYEQITLEQIEKRLHELFDWSQMSVSIVGSDIK